MTEDSIYNRKGGVNWGLGVWICGDKTYELYSKENELDRGSQMTRRETSRKL